MNLRHINPQVAIAIAIGLAAVVDDLRRRHIANWIPVAAVALGIAWQVSQNGWMGLLYALGGAAAGFAVFLVFYLLGGMGGGDVKLMAGFGALLGTGRLLEAAMWTAGVGGIMGISVLAARSVKSLVTRQAAPAGEGHDSIPYAPAIALGVWLSLIPKG